MPYLGHTHKVKAIMNMPTWLLTKYTGDFRLWVDAAAIDVQVDQSTGRHIPKRKVLIRCQITPDGGSER